MDHLIRLEYLAAAVEALPEENILFSVNSEAEKQLGELLEQKVKKIHMAASIQSDADALEQAKHADGVIVCVRKGKTCRKELIRELEACRMQKIVILGVICIDEN